jgi:uncharacterized membrane protein (DUF485 family)
MAFANGGFMSGTSQTDPSGQAVWDRVAESQPFKDLVATKKAFIIPAFLFFVVYYFLLPILVGYAPQFMATKLWGDVNLAYLFALSQFFMAWIIAGLYVKAGDNFDRISKHIIDNVAASDSPRGDR